MFLVNFLLNLSLETHVIAKSIYFNSTNYFKIDLKRFEFIFIQIPKKLV